MSLEIAEHLASFIRAHFRIPSDDPVFDDRVHLFDEGFVDSIGFVEVVSHIEQHYRIVLPDNILFGEELTTIRGIAGVIERLGGTAPSRAGADEHDGATILELAPGVGTPLFCVCGLDVYKPLADALDGDGPVYGVDLPLDAATPALPSIEETAGAYVRAIRSHHPKGPYRLAGLSHGGVVAYEVARQLTRDGEHVEIVALFESALPSAVAVGPRTAGHLAARLRRGTRVAREKVSAGARRVRDVIAGSTDESSSEPGPGRDETFARAIERYEQTVAPYAGRVVLYRADGLEGSDRGPDLGWCRVAENLEIVVVAGTQATILRAPAVETVGHELRARMLIGLAA